MRLVLYEGSHKGDENEQASESMRTSGSIPVRWRSTRKSKGDRTEIRSLPIFRRLTVDDDRRKADTSNARAVPAGHWPKSIGTSSTVLVKVPLVERRDRRPASPRGMGAVSTLSVW